MANTCYDTNLLHYSGTSQQQRALQALLSDYARIDERTTAQLILFAKTYGAYLNNFNSNNEPEGDWQALMSNDVSVIIAGIADIKAKDFSPFLATIKDEIQKSTTETDIKKHFKTVFDFIFSLASLMDHAVKQLPDTIRFTPFLSVAISSGLALPLALLNHYYQTFRNAPLSLIDESSHDADPLMPVSPVVFSDEFNIGALNKTWKVNSFSAPAITLGGVSVQDDINHILTHNLFTAPLQKFINGVINIVSKAPAYLDETLTNYPAHQPHYALYLAFLRLFRYAQDHLNQFTQNHLDFYYKEVLQLKNRNAEPGFVHLLFELQKSADQYLLAKGTTFKAGKDENNNDLLYAITHDVVLQKASVQSLNSLYLNKDIGGVLLASAVAASEDGEGAKLLSADQSWSAFRNSGKTTAASIGFAIASNLLFLNEGSRTILFTFQCNQVISLSKKELEAAFAIRFTGKRDWFDAGDYEASADGTAFTVTLTISGDAPPIVPYSEKIHKENYDAALPIAKLMLTDYQYYGALKKLNVSSITIEVTATVKDLSLQNKDGVISAAKPFKPFGDFPDSGAPFIIGSEEIFQKPLTGLNIDIDWEDVSERLVRRTSKNQLSKAYYQVSRNQYAETLAKNSQSVAVEEKAVPDDAEVIAKTMAAKSFSVSEKMTEITPQVNVTAKAMAMQDIKSAKLTGQSIYSKEELAKVYTDKLMAPADLVSLSSGSWNENMVIDKSDHIRLYPIYLNEAESKGIPVAPISFDGNKSYDIKSVSGFIKLRLITKNYSLDTYLYNSQKALTDAKVKVVMDGDTIKSYSIPAPKLAKPAPQLVANSIRITYSARTTIDFTNDVSSFCYHIEPFGTRRIDASLTKDDITLLPVFNADNGSAKGDGGELWIGIQNAVADETLLLLFQVSDGSSNPLKSMTEIKWYYLSYNNWLPLDKTQIGDETNNLTRSGIVTLTLPPDITNGNTRADASLLWIKLVADHDTDAVNRLVSIRTNAAKAAFVQDLTKGIEYKTAATANAISKPAAPIASVKKTEQPYPSFGGRLHESDNRFYIRVSERLRHKHRAVTAWDYERLVLDYFPQIHKAKCIPHTGFIISQNTNETKYSEVLPGHVMLVTVPDIKNHLSSNVLRPYTSIGLIEEVQEYLESLTSPFVTLHVSNPQFEEVQFAFGVAFLPNHDFSFYQKQLNNDIEQFLTPWAFDSGEDIEFGGKIQKSVVLNFVEERPYVDFVTDFTMNHFIANENGSVTTLTNVEEATASTARSILVSYSDEATGVKHLIQSPANCNNNG